MPVNLNDSVTLALVQTASHKRPLMEHAYSSSLLLLRASRSFEILDPCSQDPADANSL